VVTTGRYTRFLLERLLKRCIKCTLSSNDIVSNVMFILGDYALSLYGTRLKYMGLGWTG